jgi:lysophospholipase L1-like esterase
VNEAHGGTGADDPFARTSRPDTGAPPLRLVVLADSTSFTDGTGPQLPDEPTLYPNVLARRLEIELGRPVAVTVVSRPGTTARDALVTVRKDRHVQFDVIAHADALVVGVGSFDHAPAGTPAALEAMVPYLHPPALRRRARRWARAAYPRLVAIRRGHGRRTPAAEFDTLYRQLLEQLRGLTWGRAAGVTLGPTSHRSAYYGHRHPEHAAAEAAQLRLAREHGFASVAAWPLVEPHAGELNVDGIHWPAEAHEAVGHALADALLPQLRGEAPVIGLPDAARDAGLVD